MDEEQAMVDGDPGVSGETTSAPDGPAGRTKAELKAARKLAKAEAKREMAAKQAAKAERKAAAKMERKANRQRKKADEAAAKAARRAAKAERVAAKAARVATDAPADSGRKQKKGAGATSAGPGSEGDDSFAVRAGAVAAAAGGVLAELAGLVRQAAEPAAARIVERVAKPPADEAPRVAVPDEEPVAQARAEAPGELTAEAGGEPIALEVVESEPAEPVADAFAETQPEAAEWAAEAGGEPSATEAVELEPEPVGEAFAEGEAEGAEWAADAGEPTATEGEPEPAAGAIAEAEEPAPDGLAGAEPAPDASAEIGAGTPVESLTGLEAEPWAPPIGEAQAGSPQFGAPGVEAEPAPLPFPEAVAEGDAGAAEAPGADLTPDAGLHAEAFVGDEAEPASEPAPGAELEPAVEPAPAAVAFAVAADQATHVEAEPESAPDARADVDEPRRWGTVAGIGMAGIAVGHEDAIDRPAPSGDHQEEVPSEASAGESGAGEPAPFAAEIVSGAATAEEAPPQIAADEARPEIVAEEATTEVAADEAGPEIVAEEAAPEVAAEEGESEPIGAATAEGEAVHAREPRREIDFRPSPVPVIAASRPESDVPWPDTDRPAGSSDADVVGDTWETPAPSDAPPMPVGRVEAVPQAGSTAVAVAHARTAIVALTQPAVAASVDVGANSAHLLVAAISGHRIEPLLDESAFLGLGDRVATEGYIGAAAREELATTLAGYADAARSLGATAITIVGTEPVRRAADAASLVHEVEARAGVPFHVLSHHEEALLMLLGVTGGREVTQQLLVVDIGGGSSELVLVAPGRPIEATGLRVGSARITQAHARSDPPTLAEIDAMRVAVRAAVADAPKARPAEIVAVGGTASNLLKLLPATAVDRLLTRRRITVALAMLTVERSIEAAERHLLRPQRARVLPAGALIVDAILEHYGMDRLRVSDDGIREGMILAATAAGPGWRDRLPELAHGWRDPRDGDADGLDG